MLVEERRLAPQLSQPESFSLVETFGPNSTELSTVRAPDSQMEDLSFFCDGGDCDSLLQGEDQDMESLFGGDDECSTPLSTLSPYPQTSVLALPDTQLAVPAEPAAACTQQRDSDVSTLPEPQQCRELWGFPLPDPASAANLDLDQIEDEMRELEQMLAADQERERELHEEEDGEHQSGQEGPPQQPIDTPHSEASLSSEPASWPDQTGQGGENHVTVYDVDADGVDEDDDVIFMGQTKANTQTQALHPGMAAGCDGPPPESIHLRERSIEELLPYVQLDAKISLQAIYVMLDISISAGRLIKHECRQYLTKPEHAIHSSGSKDPVALRTRKVTILLSSLAFLSELGMGERWFGQALLMNPRSKYVWPADSTRLTLLFVKLLYKLQRNKEIKDRRKPSQVYRPKHGPTANTPSGLSSTALSMTGFAHDSPSCLRERLATAQKRGFSELDEPVSTESSISRSSSVVSAVMSAQSPASSVTCTTPPLHLSDSDGLVCDSEATSQHRLAKKRHQANATGVCYIAKAPDDATIRYFINITRGCERVLPRLVLGHTDWMRTAGYSFLTSRCTAMGYEVASVAVCTLLGLEEVGNDREWDRAVCRVHEAMLMDDEVRVLVNLQG
ncbi:hypothetical protein CMQ_7442 [Grosmannia clavigera kw1407]|uniref:Uncharacterized protein n=1 Tax=Grosmannia clavigera (strain kw1407 / UAMH 11150) TaxID=655863 RepID=F0XPV3_GROCL|nr:uncharacterized protein CMQ_7442 [Grosmannia clavigera kw1407]EFX00440.1 hypothetical protein CMQ_7442 [Grosmannia clavigera kw1407]